MGVLSAILATFAIAPWAYVGFESISPECISAMNKLTNTRASGDMYRSEIKQLRKWGLQTWAAFTVGHDGDTIESIRATCDFAIRNKFTFAAFNILMPYPNTPLYEKLRSENRLLYDGKWWLHEDYRFNYSSIVPKNMTPDELTETAFECRRRFNSIGSIIKRAFELHTNMRTPYRFITYLLYNPLFRKEVFKKQGDELQKLEEEFNGLSNAGENRAKFEALKENLKMRKEQLLRTGDLVKELDIAENTLHTAQEEYLKSDSCYSSGNANYEAKYHAFMNEQAGILAETLEEGCACPVCGSRNLSIENFNTLCPEALAGCDGKTSLTE